MTKQQGEEENGIVGTHRRKEILCVAKSGSEFLRGGLPRKK